MAQRLADVADKVALRWWSPDGIASTAKSDGRPVTAADVAVEHSVLDPRRAARDFVVRSNVVREWECAEEDSLGWVRHRVPHGRARDAVAYACGRSMKADQWWESGYVDALHDQFAVIAVDHDQFAVIAVDRIGHGQSAKPHDPRAYEESLVIRDLVAVLYAEGVDRTLVWGFSMGAATAAELAIRHPERVFALVCAGGGPFPPEPDREARILDRSEAAATVAGFAEMMRGFGVDDEGIAEIAGRNDLVALSLSMRASAHWSPAGAEIGCPMMWYVGSDDLGGFLPGDLELADRHGFETFEIEGATHASAFTEAAIPLTSVIPFLQRHAARLCEL